VKTRKNKKAFASIRLIHRSSKFEEFAEGAIRNSIGKFAVEEEVGL
jgi:hypothetical protein